ncbi:AmpC Beta-lactamase class C [Pyrenophora tritici-repentis]|uniref:Beta-lactamase n=2 Tax=Pyrenophora tritici-repentis TaxID=45151 RepID=A0A2W1HL74_9PLEO|nr:beta-lactamase [Pyrenophora tritici-repentis Pt-1C-BFP]KAA8620924.1 beta-lactamase [Pyrenophora tritici-repentis]EDU43362.1 beta-lactamase [Pyrenophora tritici-repentis Pt-1C-BFP]KAF7450168.1 beta-lactamase [Pyrenophora tritici-repentis]KAF7572737.1 penicillin binding protein [Pyrenophora tritici-repentis]KAG9376139.1 beta-lactamase [Pyrenophora tritici-repentis]
MAQVQGTTSPRFAKVHSLFQSFLDSGSELGASICVNIDGTDVVDLWGGYADAARSQRWEKDTITCVWSSSKTITALATLVCIDRGLLDPTEKVVKYWPEFGVNGKQNVEVRHLLSHAAGLSGWQEAVTVEDICNLEKATKLLEQQAPWWEPGSAMGYHAMTMGHLLAELVRRVTGVPFQDFVLKELAGPLNADFRYGVKKEDLGRVAQIIPPPPLKPEEVPEIFKDPSSLGFRTLAINPGMNAEDANGELWRISVVPAANGFSNARGLVRLLSPLSLQDESVLSQKTAEKIFVMQQQGNDIVMGAPVKFGLGFGLSAPETIFENLPEGRVASWGGWGGSQVIVDLENQMTISYVMNKMENAGMGQIREEGEKRGMGNQRTNAFVKAIYEALEAK